MELRKNKRGVTTFMLIAVVFLGFALMVMLIIGSFAAGKIDDSMSELTGQLGNTSIQEVYQANLQPGIIAMKTTVPQIISTGVLLGMVICMFIVGYGTKKLKQIWILLDIGIIIAAEALSVIVKSSFIEFINLSPEMLSIARDILPLGAKFILNLPTTVPIMGAVIILATHFITKDKEEDTTQSF